MGCKKHTFIYKICQILVILLGAFFVANFTFVSVIWAQDYIEYEIHKGDSLWSIARQFRLSIQDIASTNNLSIDDTLYPGLILKIPHNKLENNIQEEPPVTVIHTVQKGESLWDIAQRYRLSLEYLSQINELTKPDNLYIGQEIKIPIPESKSEKKDVKINDFPEKSEPLVFQEEKSDLKEIVYNLNQEFRESVKDKEIDYVVKPGENLWTIAQNYQVSLKELSQFNNLENINQLSIGQIIKIPLGDIQKDDRKEKDEPEIKEPENNWIEHIVVYGETLSTIAQKYYIPIETICQLNQLTTKDYIYPGQRIKIKVDAKDASEVALLGEEKEIQEENLSKPDNAEENNYKDSKPEVSETIYYTVKAGDTLWSIAQKYGVSIEGILAVNYLSNKDKIQVGTRLEIPALGGDSVKTEIIEYKVVKGDTLWSIAQRFQVRMYDIINLNQLKNVNQLSVGQKLNIPASALTASQSSSTSTTLIQDTARKDIVHYVQKGETLWQISRQYQVSLKDITKANNISETSRIYVGQKLLIPNARSTPRNAPSFIWPINGLITSHFGIRTLGGRRDYHTGIDIDGRTGGSIKAAESGKVSFSGYISGYGNVVIIDHIGGYSTVYAHNSANLVQKGQSVNKGDIIARVGATGNATGSHLHFEIRLNGKPVNPLNYLP